MQLQSGGGVGVFEQVQWCGPQQKQSEITDWILNRNNHRDERMNQMSKKTLKKIYKN